MNCGERYEDDDWSDCSWIFLGFSCTTASYGVCTTVMIYHILISFSAVQMYGLSNALTCIRHHLQVNYGLTMWPAVSWLDIYSSVARSEHCTDITEVMVLNPVQTWIFSGPHKLCIRQLQWLINHIFERFKAQNVSVSCFCCCYVDQDDCKRYTG